MLKQFNRTIRLTMLILTAGCTDRTTEVALHSVDQGRSGELVGGVFRIPAERGIIPSAGANLSDVEGWLHSYSFSCARSTMTDQLKDGDSQDAQTAIVGKDSSPEAERPSNAAARSEVQVEDSQANCCYSNFCRVTGTPEELILDFGLNAQPMGATNVEIKQRLIVNYFTAKRLLQALAMSIQRHENAFGVLETDVQKRVAPNLRRAQAPA